MSKKRGARAGTEVFDGGCIHLPFPPSPPFLASSTQKYVEKRKETTEEEGGAKTRFMLLQNLSSVTIFRSQASRKYPHLYCSFRGMMDTHLARMAVGFLPFALGLAREKRSDRGLDK